MCHSLSIVAISVSLSRCDVISLYDSVWVSRIAAPGAEETEEIRSEDNLRGPYVLCGLGRDVLSRLLNVIVNMQCPYYIATGMFEGVKGK